MRGSLIVKLRHLSPTRKLIAVLAVFGFLGIVGVYLWLDYSIAQPKRQALKIDETIESMRSRCPDNMTQASWDEAVNWTINLNANSMIWEQANREHVSAFRRELLAKLENDVDTETIIWIWDQYALLCPHGAKYNERFRSVMLRDMSLKRNARSP